MYEGYTKSSPDERIKLLSFFSYVMWLALVPDFLMLGTVVGVMVVLLVFCVPFPVLLLRRWLSASPAALVIIFLYWIFAPGGQETWFTFWGREFGPGGLTQGTFFAARFLGFLLGGFYLFGISSPEKAARAVLWFLTPLRLFRIPIHLLYYVVWFAMRSIPVLTEEAQTTGLAQRARGARLTGSPARRLNGMLSLIVPVFAAAVRRADRFALSLEARGFDPAKHYFSHRRAVLKPADLVWFLGLAVAWVLFIVWRWRV